ncbi:DUF721 domain-containing protein [Streptomyces bikiniensis]|uniref:DciA family protein n=1 Tax=Streptomyces bikiniensis TaxID=1896 RepID=UPI000524F512|nr:DciA family protein [Streptomyces bikiniensis]
MNTVPELSGVDLARQALLAAREAAKKNGAQTKMPKRRTGTALRRDGREPLGLGAAISMMMTERGLVAPAAGGSVLARFDDILAAAAPELAGHVRAVGFDADIGRLGVVPDSPAYGTKVRWIAPKLIAAANEVVPEADIRTINVLAPAARTVSPATSPAAADPAPRPVVPAVPVKTRETASAGYRRALEAHRAVTPPRQEDPVLATAVGRQEQVRLGLGARMFPHAEEGHEDEVVASLEDVCVQQRQANENTRIAAILRARAERAGRAVSLAAPVLRQAG